MEHKIKVRVRKRIVLIYLIMIIGSCLLLLRLSFVKIVSGADIYTRALEQWLRRAPVEAREETSTIATAALLGSALAPSLVAIPKQVKDVEKPPKS